MLVISLKSSLLANKYDSILNIAFEKYNKSPPLQLEDTLWAGLTDLHVKIPMGITAENLAEKYQITREDCDNYAYQTQQRWKAGNV